VRRIKIQPPTNDAAWKRWNKKCQKATQENWEKVNQGEKPIFDETIYKKYKEFFMASAFHGKCGYCECPIKDCHQGGDVEHFRPKGRVTNAKDEVILDHLGYHWLAYDWQNLLISCKGCNQVAKQKIYGKGNRFPVSNNYAYMPEAIAHEKPLLINPTSNLSEDFPSKHLAINPDCSLRGLTNRGVMCIQVFGLNLRDQLKTQRRVYYRDALRLQAQLKSESQDERNEAIREIIAIKEGKEPFSIAQAEAVAALKALWQENQL
jgi:uncharacterized protein (TIGR02646 family)